MRLIDADALIEHLRKDPLFCLVEPYGITEVIEAEPTVDPAERSEYGYVDMFRLCNKVAQDIAERRKE